MSRIAPLLPPYDDETRQAFDQITPPGRTPLVLFRTLARSARVYRKFRAGGLLDRGSLSLRQREIVINRICALNRCEYEWGVHIRVFAEKAALSEAQVAATVTGGTADWSADERALLNASEELNRCADLSDSGWVALRAHFDDEQVLEILALVNFYRGVSLIANTLRLPLESFAARFPG